MGARALDGNAESVATRDELRSPADSNDLGSGVGEDPVESGSHYVAACMSPREEVEDCVDGVAQLQSSAARPGGFVRGDFVAEDLTAFGPEDRPGRRKVSGGVAVAGGAPVENCGDVALLDQHVAWDQVVVNEAGRGGVVQLVRLGSELAYAFDVEEVASAGTDTVEPFEEKIDVGSDRDALVADVARSNW